MPSSDPSPSRVASLYDRYLDAMLRGEEIRPSEFGDDAVWLEALHDLTRPSDEVVERRGSRPPLPAAEADLPFEMLGDYRLLRRLGEGGMGVVYMAEQASLGRLVALKVLRPELSGSPTAAARFAREARAAARLNHPGIVGVHWFGTERGVQFLAMDLLAGANLDALLAEELRVRGAPLGVQRALTLGIQLADALQAAHEVGVVHRDVKPGNVRVLPGDRAMLLDFGLARDLESGERTLTRSFAGSPQYAAPEQVDKRFGPVEPRTDVYGLGATLYECVTGRPPFDSDSVDRLLADVVSTDPPAPRSLRPELARDLDVVLKKALEKEPFRRYSSAREFGDDLRAIAEFRAVQARPSRVWTRVGKAVRRHPGRALLGLGLVVLSLAGWGWSTWRAAGRRAQAAETVAALREELTAVEERRQRVVRQRFRLDLLSHAEQTRGLNAGEERQLEALRAQHAEHLRLRELLFERGQVALRDASQLDPDAALLQDTWAWLHYQRWLEVRAAGDAAATELCLSRMAEHDLEGAWQARVDADGAFSVLTPEAGVPVHLFRYARLADVGAGEELRIAAMRSFGPADPWPPGEFALRVHRPAGPLRSTDVVLELAGHAIRDCMLVDASASEAVRVGDRLLRVDGGAVTPSRRAVELGEGRCLEFLRDGAVFEHLVAPGDGLVVVPAEDFAARHEVPARVWRDGGIVDLVLVPGAEFRTTASPHLVGPDRLFDATPIERSALAPGWYLAILRAPGCEELRLPFHVDNPAEYYARCAELSCELWPTGTTPDGFVRIASDAFAWREPPFLLAETEVTCAEFARFLDDPVTRADPELRQRAWPRFAAIREQGGSAVVAAGDRELPVLGVTWHAALAYVAWLNQTAPRPEGFEFALPTFGQWERASKGGDSRAFVFGNEIRPEWIGAEHYGQGGIEPVRSHPIDESPYGVFDLAAGAREWCADEAEPGSGLRIVAGGSFRSARAEELQIGHTVLDPADTAPDLGMRVVLRSRSVAEGEPR